MKVSMNPSLFFQQYNCPAEFFGLMDDFGVPGFCHYKNYKNGLFGNFILQALKKLNIFGFQ